ncbi:MAG: response regulator transcription factor [Verrucomicrobiota bacterium]
MKTTARKLRILIADDHEMIRQGLRRVLGTHPHWEICGEAVNGREAVEQAQQLKPDVVVLDLSMPHGSGLVATRAIRKALPQTEVLILTMHDSEQMIREVLAAGARGYLLKSDAGTLLLAAVESVSRSKPFFTPKAGDLMLRDLLAPGQGGAAAPSELTAREEQVLKLIAEDLSSKEIANKLGLSVKTVETHRVNLMRKLNLHSVSAVVRYVLTRSGIVP